MSKNNDLLKEAIADAKAVRETAIANAKLALEEAFTPKLQSMLSAKLQEDDMEDEELEDEMPTDDVATEEMEDEMEDEMSEMEDEEDLDGMDMEENEDEFSAEDEEEVPMEGDYSEETEEEEDLELEAIIRELEGEEAPEEEEEEVPMEGDYSEGEDEDDDIDLDEVIRSLSEEDEDEHEMEEESDDAEAELEEAYKTIRSLKDTLVEVNLLNAKLLFSNKLFKSNNLSESQKMKVIETFDRAVSLREVKLVYTTLSESFTGRRTAKRAVTEGFASKKSNSTAPKGRIVESNGMADRMKRLAGLL